MKKSMMIILALIITCSLIVGTPDLGLLKVTVVNLAEQPISNVPTYVLDQSGDKIILEATTNQSGQFVLQADPGKYSLYVNGEFVQTVEVLGNSEVVVVVSDEILAIGATGTAAGSNAALYTGLAVGTVAVGAGVATGIIVSEDDASED